MCLLSNLLFLFIIKFIWFAAYSCNWWWFSWLYNIPLCGYTTFFLKTFELFIVLGCYKQSCYGNSYTCLQFHLRCVSRCGNCWFVRYEHAQLYQAMTNCFLKCLYPFTLLPAEYDTSHSSSSSQTFGIVILCNFNQSSDYVTVSHCILISISLLTKDIAQFFIYLIGCLNVLFDGLPAQHFYSFFYQVVSLTDFL